MAKIAKATPVLVTLAKMAAGALLLQQRPLISGNMKNKDKFPSAIEKFQLQITQFLGWQLFNNLGLSVCNQLILLICAAIWLIEII